jgi:hypothetical protein
MRACCRLVLLGAVLAWPTSGPAAEGPTRWSFSASAYGYFVPKSRNYLNPNLAADRGGLHLEARYNYEALETGSVWVGWNLAFGGALALEVTPMLGGVVGSTSGIAPGYLFSLAYHQIALSSQGEYLLAFGGRMGDFLYTWSELTWSPAEWFRAGIAIQRTRAWQSSLDVQRGLLAAVSVRKVELAAYLFNPGWTTPTLVVAVTGRM